MPRLLPWLKPPSRQYTSVFHEVLNTWPVWLPGDEINVGDFGVLEDACFASYGSLSSHMHISRNLVRHRSTPELEVQFGNISEVGGGIRGGAATVVSLEIDVSATKGVFLRASGMRSTAFLPPYEVLNAVSRTVFGEISALIGAQDLYVVTEVYEAESFIIIAGRRHGGSLRLTVPSRGVLDALSVGEFIDDATLNVQSETSLQLTGRGPLALGLFRATGAARPFVPQNVPFRRVSPQDVMDPS